MPIVMNEDFRKGCDSLLENVAIGAGVKGYIRELLRIIDEHDCAAQPVTILQPVAIEEDGA